jgi:hypothetical protein
VTNQALKTIYPEYNWKKPKKRKEWHWDDVNNKRKFFDELAVKLDVQKPEDWNNVKVKTVIQMGGKFIKARTYNNSLRRGTFHGNYSLICNKH